METADDRGSASSRLRALLPLLLTILVLVVGLAWLIHASRARAAQLHFVVTVEGVQHPYYRASLNGIPFQGGQPCGLGSKRLVIEAPDAEPFQTNIHTWYSGADLGTIVLQHSKGTLALDIAPTRNQTSIRGLRFQKEIADCSRESLVVPVGEYEVVSHFEHFRVAQRVSILRNTTGQAKIHPAVTAAHLQSDPDGSEFLLEARNGQSISLNGKTPVIYSGLPVGTYSLRMWRGNFRKEATVELKAEPTNTVEVKFDYAKVTFVSDPPGAQVRAGDEVLGMTPMTASLIPGGYRVTFAREGYYNNEVEFRVGGDEKREVSATLGNIAFGEAIRRAESAFNLFNPNYTAALEEVEEAIRIKPENVTALRLREDILFRQTVAQAYDLARKNNIDDALSIVKTALEKRPTDDQALRLRAELERSKRDIAARAAEDRRRRPQELLSDKLRAIPYSDYFETASFDVKGDASKVRDAVLRAVSSKGGWTLKANTPIGDGIFIVDAEWKSLISKQRAFVLVDQFEPSSCRVYFRLVDYILSNNIQFTFKEGITDDSWRPLHRNFSSYTPHVVDSQRARSLQGFRQKLDAELKSL